VRIGSWEECEEESGDERKCVARVIGGKEETAEVLGP